jgi:hypothetical protein
MNPDREVLPAELAELVDACLKLQPDARPADTASVIRVLDEAATVLSIVGTVRMGDGGMVREVTGLAPRDARPVGATPSPFASGATTPLMPLPAAREAPPPSALLGGGPPALGPPALGSPALGPPALGPPASAGVDPGTRLFLTRLAIALVVAVAVAVAIAAALVHMGARDDVYVVPPTR